MEKYSQWKEDNINLYNSSHVKFMHTYNKNYNREIFNIYFLECYDFSFLFKNFTSLLMFQ